MAKKEDAKKKREERIAKRRATKEGKAKKEPKGEKLEKPKVDESKDAPKKQRTIGDQLREEGLIEEPPEIERADVAVERKGLTDVLMRLDKVEGKIELSTEGKKASDERMGMMSEQLGDLRRMVLDREKSSSELEANFDKVRMITEDLDPSRITRKFQKFDGELEKQRALLEKMDISLDKYGERLKKVETQFATIKSFRNLMKVTEKIDARMKNAEKTKRDTDRMAAKVEAVFSDMNEKLGHIRKERETIAKLDELVNDLMKDHDRLKFKFEQDTLKKSQLDDVKEELVKEARGISPKSFEDLTGRIEKLELEKHDVDELEKEKEEIQKLLVRAEKDYKDAKLSHDTYEDFKNANEGRLTRINAVLEFLSKKMLYQKIKEGTKQIGDMAAKVEKVPSREEFNTVKKEADHVKAMLGEIKNLQKQLESVDVNADRIYTLEKSLEHVNSQLQVASEVKERMDDLVARREELVERLYNEGQKLGNAEKRIGTLNGRLEEAFKKILSLEGELEALERKESIPVDLTKMRRELFELKNLIEDTRLKKADKKTLKEFEGQMERFIERHAEIIKKLAERED